MRIIVALLAVVFLFSSPALAVNLTVVKTLPPDGADNVDSNITEIKIFFSAPVKMNSWSFVETGQGDFPSLSGQPRFEGNTICVLPVVLEPGVVYSLGINSPNRKGFKLAADETITCEPYELTFRTAQGSQSRATPPAPQPISPAPQSAAPGQQPIMPPSPGGGQGQGPGLQTSAAGIVGIWLYRDQYEEVVLEFKPNGTYDLRTRSAEGVMNYRGGYSHGQGYILATPEGEEPLRVKTNLLGSNTLEIWIPQDNGELMHLQMERWKYVPPLTEWSPAQPGDQQQPGYQQPGYQQPGSQQPGYQQQGYPQQGYQQKQPQAQGRQKTILLQRYHDRTENAFSLLVPSGWVTGGGMTRVDPNQAGGPAQSVEAKLDFAVASDNQGTVMLRWLPHIYYADPSDTPAGRMGLFQPGSNYGGMTVMPVMSPAEFAAKMAFPYLHPQAQNARLVEQKDLPRMTSTLQQMFNGSPLAFLGFQYAAGMIAVEYEENGRTFLEKILVIIENRGAAVAGQWTNRFTVAARAPKEEFQSWEPIWSIISNSSQLNPQWVAGEVQGQIKRGEIVIKTQQQIQEIERSIVEHRQKINAEISNDMYLTLTEQEEYLNPYTGQIEIGTNQWPHRWQNDRGDVLYTTDPSYDPNTDPNANLQGFRKSQIRPRYGS